MLRSVKITLLLLGTTLVMAGCGVRGSLELPPEQKAQAQTSATADSGQGKSEGAAPKPHKGFILDGLLR